MCIILCIHTFVCLDSDILLAIMFVCVSIQTSIEDLSVCLFTPEQAFIQFNRLYSHDSAA